MRSAKLLSLTLLIFLTGFQRTQAEWFTTRLHNSCSEPPFLITAQYSPLTGCSPSECTCQGGGSCISGTCSSTIPSSPAGFAVSFAYSSPDCAAGSEVGFYASSTSTCGVSSDSSAISICSEGRWTFRQFAPSTTCSGGTFFDTVVGEGCSNTPNNPQKSSKVMCGGSSPPSSSPIPSLPSDCYDPPGTNCSWYQDCLEKRQPCGTTSPDAYALPYGTKFCQLYAANYAQFSSEGQRWIGAVRKCLQQALVPLLDSPPSCATIKQRAFQSHTGCYTAPAPGVSVCFVINDVIDILSTIKGAFGTDAKETILQSLQSFSTCLGIYYDISSIYVEDELSDISQLLTDQIGGFINQIKNKIFVIPRSSLFPSRKRVTGETEYYLVIGGTSDSPADDVMESIITGQKNGSLAISGSIRACDEDHCGISFASSTVPTAPTVLVFLVVIILTFNI